MPPAGFETPFPATKRPRNTYALDSAATGIGPAYKYFIYKTN
jgi:hypothetical protein